MKQFNIRILAADHVFYEGPCESLNVPTTHGLFGILANHSNIISAIVPGKLSFRIPGEENQYAAVSEGLLKVENNEVLVLVDSAERPEEIDANRALPRGRGSQGRAFAEAKRSGIAARKG